MRFLAVLLAIASLEGATLPATQRKLNVDSFEYVWKTIRDKHWDKSLDGPEWQKAHDELLPKVENAKTQDEARAAIKEMIGRLHLTHYAIVPGELYSDLSSRGDVNIDLRVVNGKALVMGSKYAGWEIGGMERVIGQVEKNYEHSTMRDLVLSRAVSRELSDKPAELSDGSGKTATVEPADWPRRGEPTQFGNLPTEYVWFESRNIGDAGGDVGYFAFNMFLDPERIIGGLSKAVDACSGCKGFIIDLRGNPGGIGGMAMGMAGFFVSQPNLQLGKMIMRETSLKFFINPRQPHFDGPLAILVDGLSASTSEIFAEGLKDIGRARIFGTPTAGAALPSVFEKLPNGDGFQYAIANYISENGKPLEGSGVKPDVEVAPTREALLAGKDLALDAAIQWMKP